MLRERSAKWTLSGEVLIRCWRDFALSANKRQPVALMRARTTQIKPRVVVLMACSFFESGPVPRFFCSRHGQRLAARQHSHCCVCRVGLVKLTGNHLSAMAGNTRSGSGNIYPGHSKLEPNEIQNKLETEQGAQWSTRMTVFTTISSAGRNGQIKNNGLNRVIPSAVLGKLGERFHLSSRNLWSYSNANNTTREHNQDSSYFRFRIKFWL